MRLALVVDTPRLQSTMANTYAARVIEAVAQQSGIAVEVVRVPVLDHDMPGGKPPPVAMLRDARPELLENLVAARPDAVLSLGAPALNALGGEVAFIDKKGKLRKRPRSLAKEHGRMRWLDLCADGTCGVQVPWTPASAPGSVVRSPDLHRDFTFCAWKAVTQWAPLPPLDVETVVPDSVASLSDALAVLEGTSVVGVDVETSGLSPYRDGLLAVGVGACSDVDMYGAGTGYSVVVTRDLLADPAALDLLWDATWRRTRRSVGHNFKFDMQFLEPAVGFPPEGAIIGDTLLLAHLLDERPNRPGSRARGSGLKELVAQRYDYQYGFDFGEFYGLIERGEDRPEDWDRMHLYLGDDCAYTARLWHDEVADAEDESPRLLRAHDDLLIPASVAVAKAEYAGAPVDLDWATEETLRIKGRIDRRKASLERAIPALAPTMVVTKVLSPQQIADVMYDEWGWTPDVRKHGRLVKDDRSTDQDHIKAALAKYGKRPGERRRVAWLRSLQLLRKDVRLATTYQKSMLARVDSDGRLRASFLLHGASTGRLSSREPNLQNVPAVDDREERSGRWWYKIRDGSWVTHPMRRAFAAPPGRKFAEVDYKQLELRVAAGISGDQAFTDVFRGGRDIHREVAAAIFSKAPKDVLKPERYLAKAVSFGILYGRTAEALAGGEEMDVAVREMGLQRWTVAQAEAFTRSFLRSYPDLEKWIAATHASVIPDGYVETPWGRRRRFPLAPRSQSERNSIFRQAVNTPIQAQASDICIEAMAALTTRLEVGDIDAVVLFPVHDSVCFEVADEDVGKLEAVCREVMEHDWEGVPLEVDFEWGQNWADVTPHG